MSITNGWFSEVEAMWPGQKFSLQVEKVLFHEKSDFQDVLVFQSATYGKVLVLDGVIQVTERDEFAYQEMLTHIPCFAHPHPKRVLIVGGGDGGILREVARHACVENIDMCEIDPMVCDVSKKFEFSTATAFGDPRLRLVHEDAAEFVKREGNGQYDVIIVDSSDPVGPAETLFKPEFFLSMKNALSPGGIVATQGECLWLHLKLIRGVLESCASTFTSLEYAFTTMPTYPSGQIGFVVGSTAERDLSTPAREPDAAMAQDLRYYSPAVHRSAFVLPAFAEREVSAVRKRFS
ncbi:spermidine/spermine synthase [Tribonema minus]|uniref:Spermidine/spermine synthase n=1 Tax=Tribonema minus TaxID=303371 RepID=A0A835ZDK7_9STRA|nr:spermidine/spermine synthase [Tribonema minus]